MAAERAEAEEAGLSVEEWRETVKVPPWFRTPPITHDTRDAYFHFVESLWQCCGLSFVHHEFWSLFCVDCGRNAEREFKLSRGSYKRIVTDARSDEPKHSPTRNAQRGREARFGRCSRAVLIFQ